MQKQNATNLQTHIDDAFLGMNAATRPEQLPAGIAQVLENLIAGPPSTEGTSSGWSRPGFQGLWTTALTGPLYPVCTARTSGASVLIVASAGKLYRATASGATPDEIFDQGGGSFAGPNGGADFRIIQFGGFLYGVDGGNTAPFRIDPATWTTVRLAGITAPSTAITTLSTYSRETDPTDGGSSTNWTGQSAPIWASGPFNMNYHFTDQTRTATPADWQNTGGGWNSRVCDDWEVLGQCERWEGPPGPTNANITPQGPAGDSAFLFDQPDNGLRQVVTSIPAWSTSSDQPTRNARIYIIDTSYNANNVIGGIAPYVVRISARDADDNVLGTYERVVTPIADIASGSAAGTGVTWRDDRWVASFMGLSQDPDNLLFELLSTDAMVPITDASPSVVFLDSASVTASALRLTAGPSDDNSRIRIERTDRGTLPLTTTGRYTSFLWIRRTFGTVQDWSEKSELVFGITWNPAATAGFPAGTYPAMRLGFQAIGGDVAWTPPVSYAADGSSFSVSLSTIAPALLGAFTYLYMQILDDMPEGSDGTAWLYDFGPFTEPALTPDIPVRYYYSYFDGTVPSDPLLRVGTESSRSPVSAQVVPTATARAVTLTIPAGAYPTGVDYLLLWRVGGAYDDGRGRLVAALPVGANATGSTYDWNFTTRVVNDWTPDASLAYNALYEEGRDQLPVGATSIISSNGRLVFAKGVEVSYTWPLSADPDDGVYTTNAPNPSDPSFVDKGYSFTVDGPDGPPIVNLSTRMATALNDYGAILAAWRDRDHIPISGSEPGTYQAWPAVSEGLFAPRGIAHDERNELYHVGVDGLYRVANDAGGSMIRSQAIEPLFSTASIGDGTGYAGSSLLYHDRRLYLFAPVAGGDENTVVYVWDSRLGDNPLVGWSQWVGQTGFTGGLSLSRSGDTDLLFFCGNDGQLYAVTGTEDKPTPTGAQTPITVRIITRRFGQKDSQTEYKIRLKRPQFFGFDIECVGETETMDWKIRTSDDAWIAGTWALQQGRNARKLNGLLVLDGVSHQVEYTISCTDRVTFHSVLLATTPGRVLL